MATQRIDLIGYVGKDAELRSTPNGKAVANFSLATTDRYNDETTWWQVTIWGKLAEAITQYITKGTQMHISGTMTNPKQRTYESNGEQVVGNYEITAREVDLLGGKNDNGAKQEASIAKEQDEIPL